MSLAPSMVFFSPACTICVPRPMLSSSRGWESREETGGERAPREVRWRDLARGQRGWEQVSRAELLCFPLRMAFVLHQAGPPHSHGSRGAEYAPLEEGPGEPLPLGNTSVRAAFVHVLGDLLQSLGVLAASVLIYFKVLCVQACPRLHPPAPHPAPLLAPLVSLPTASSPLPSTPGSLLSRAWPLSPQQGSRGPLRSCLSKTPLGLPLEGSCFPDLEVSLSL